VNLFLKCHKKYLSDNRDHDSFFNYTNFGRINTFPISSADVGVFKFQIH
jgi:hypothetical protein